MKIYIRLIIVLICLLQITSSIQSQQVRIDMSGTQKWVFIENRLEPSNSGKSLFIGHVSGFNDDLTGNRNVFLGDSTGFFNTIGYDNVAVGFSSLLSNMDGYYNTGVGAGALALNTTGFENTAIGAGSLLSNVDGYFNTAIGTGSLRFNTTGFENTAVGTGALLSNIDGAYNTVTGYQAMHLNTSGYSNTALGYHSMFSNIDGIRNTATGLFSLFQNTDGSFNTANGYRSMYSNTSGTSNVAMGNLSLTDNTLGIRNTSLGASTLSNNTEGNYNVASGFGALNTNTTGSDNSAYGHLASYYNVTGSNNVAIGSQALFLDSLGVNNTAIGYQSGYFTKGSNNVFLGHKAGLNELGSGKLYISNDDSAAPLIWGDFVNDTVRINGTLDINNSYKFPNIDGIAGQLLKTDGAGQTFWSVEVEDDPQVGANQVNYLSKWDGTSLVKSDGIIETAGGNVGIGIASPNAKLDVAGGMRISEGSREFLIPGYFPGSGAVMAAVFDGIGNHPYLRLQDTTAALPGSTWIDLGANSIGDFEVQINDGTKMTIQPNGNIGIGMVPVTNKLEVNGTASNSTGGNWLVNSDKRLKKNIEYMNAENILEKVLQMKGASYEWNDDVTGNDRPKGVRYGFVAQDLQKIWPTRVEEDNRGYLQTAYGAYDAMFVESIKALNTKNELLEAELEKQKGLNAELISEMEKVKNLVKQYDLLEKRLVAIEGEIIMNNE